MKNILKFSIAIGLYGTGLIATNAFAAGTYYPVCTSGVGNLIANPKTSPYASECPQGKGVSQFSGDAEKEISQFGTDIKSAGDAIANAILEATTTEVNTIKSNTAEMLKVLTNITNSQIKDQLTQSKLMLDMRMEYMTELQERELKASQSVIGMDDTKEEVLFIISELKNVGNQTDGKFNHAHEVIAAMKEKYDEDPEFVIPVRIKSASGENSTCEEYDADKHKAGQLDPNCFYSVKATPGEKLEKYFQECSRVKREALVNVQSNISKTAATRKQTKSQSTYMAKAQTQQPAEMALTKVSSQVVLSCTPKEFGYKLCSKDVNGNEMETKDYLTKVINNEIVPYGNISSSNYLEPVSVGSVDGDVDMTDDEIEAIRLTALNRDANVVVSSNTPPIVKTYRTSTQYYAAEDYINNIINREAVSNINTTRSSSADTATFQAKFMSRAASLSLAENSLRQPMAMRTGESLSTALADGTLTRNGVVGDDGKIAPLKEDVNGAGELDRIMFAVNKDYSRISSDAKSAINSGGTIGIQTAAPGTLAQWQVEALVQNNKLLLMENDKNERIELLLAAILANITNSESNVNYINSFKYK